MVGQAASELYANAQAMLSQLIGQKQLTAKAVFGLFPAQRIGADSVQAYDLQGQPTLRFEHLRQQSDRAQAGATGKPG